MTCICTKFGGHGFFGFGDFAPFCLPEGKQKSSKIYKTGEAMLNKLGADAYLVKLYLHEFFELILFFDFMDYLIQSGDHIKCWVVCN